MLDQQWLQTLVQSPHVSTDAVADYRARYAAHPARLLVVPSFLQEVSALRLATFLDEEAIWTRKYQLYHNRLTAENATPEEWAAAPIEDRFFRFSTGSIPTGRLSTGIAECIRLHRALHDARLRQWFEAVTANRLGNTKLTMHAMEAGDFLRLHQDSVGRRKVAFVLYLTPGWVPDYGGQLCLEDQSGIRFTLEPEFNSLVLFDVHGHAGHWVEAISSAARSRRLSIGGWFDAAEASDV